MDMLIKQRASRKTRKLSRLCVKMVITTQIKHKQGSIRNPDDIRPFFGSTRGIVKRNTKTSLYCVLLNELLC